jgi:hypothetical protein
MVVNTAELPVVSLGLQMGMHAMGITWLLRIVGVELRRQSHCNRHLDQENDSME